MMKTEKEKIAEITSDVRKATRERAETEYAEAMALKRELYKEMRTNRRANKEKLSDFYFKISLLFLTSSAIPCLSIFIKNEDIVINWIYVGFGLVASLFFALMAYNILKD